MKALKTGMVALLRAGVAADRPTQGLVARLRELGGDNDAEKIDRDVKAAVRAGEGDQAKSRGLQRAREAVQAQQGPRAPPSPAFAAPTPPAELHQAQAAVASMLEMGQRAALDGFLQQLSRSSRPVLADLVLANLAVLPEPPPGVAPAAAYLGDRTFQKMLVPLAGPVEVATSDEDPAKQVKRLRAEAAAAVGDLAPAEKRLLHGEALARVLAAEQEEHNYDAFDAHVRSLLAARLVAVDALVTGEDGGLGAMLEHVLAMYQAARGHDLALDFLYALYALEMTFAKRGEDAWKGSPGGKTPKAEAAEQLPVYRRALAALVAKVREGVPPHEKALARLLLEAPLLPADLALTNLEEMCFPRKAEAEAEEVAEEVATLALTALRDLVLLRPAVRFPCLALVLRCSVAADGALRSKAIRLVANKIHPRPISGLAPEIEQFAVGTLDEVTARGARGEAVPPEEVSRHFELLFALCTKKPALLRELLAIYGKSPRAQQQCIYESIDVLAKRVGAQAPVFVELVRQVPAGSEDLLLRMLNVANEAAAALPEDLSAALKDQYARTKDVRFVLPALGSLPKAALLQMLPDLVAGLSAQQFQTALGLCFRPDRTQAGASLDGPLAPADLLYALHLIDPRTSAVPLGKVKDAITCCFKLPEVFDFRVTSAALVRLMEVRPFPLMLMRTVLQTCSAHPTLKTFVVDLLRKLVARQVWADETQFEGFLRCIKACEPKSLPVLLGLPTASLTQALAKFPEMTAPLQHYAANPAVFAATAQSTLRLLKLIK